MKLVIYMPALNEEEGIAEVIRTLPKNIQGIDQIQVLVVDDGSTDDTTNIAKQNGADVVTHATNKGVGAAFQSAVKYSLENSADILVSIDADKQFDSNQVPDIIQPLLQNKADMVTGNRFTKGMPENMPKTKYWGNKQMSKLISLITGQKFTDVSCGFRAYNKEALLNLNLFGQFTYTQESIMEMIFKGLRVVEFPITAIYYKGRKSRVAGNILKYAINTSSIIFKTVRSYKPMIIFSTIALISFIIALALESYVLIQYLSNTSVDQYNTYGFIGLAFLLFSILSILIGNLSEMLVRVRKNQERILYEIKKGRYT